VRRPGQSLCSCAYVISNQLDPVRGDVSPLEYYLRAGLKRVDT
jgi:hypothetical protein